MRRVVPLLERLRPAVAARSSTATLGRGRHGPRRAPHSRTPAGELQLQRFYWSTQRRDPESPWGFSAAHALLRRRRSTRRGSTSSRRTRRSPGWTTHHGPLRARRSRRARRRAALHPAAAADLPAARRRGTAAAASSPRSSGPAGSTGRRPPSSRSTSPRSKRRSDAPAGAAGAPAGAAAARALPGGAARRDRSRAAIGKPGPDAGDGAARERCTGRCRSSTVRGLTARRTTADWLAGRRGRPSAQVGLLRAVGGAAAPRRCTPTLRARPLPRTGRCCSARATSCPGQILCHQSGWSVIDFDDSRYADPLSEVAAMYAAMPRELRLSADAGRARRGAPISTPTPPAPASRFDRDRWRWYLALLQLAELGKRLMKGRVAPGETHAVLDRLAGAGGRRRSTDRSASEQAPRPSACRRQLRLAARAASPACAGAGAGSSG